MIRVSALKEKHGLRDEAAPDGFTRPQLLAEIRHTVEQLTEVYNACLEGDVMPELDRKGIKIKPYGAYCRRPKRRTVINIFATGSIRY